MTAQRLAQAKGLGDSRRDESGIANRREGDEVSAVREVIEHGVRRFKSQPRFAGAARTGERDQSAVVAQQKIMQHGEFFLTPDQTGGRCRQVVRMDRRGLMRRGGFHVRHLEVLGQQHRQIVFDQILQFIRRRKRFVGNPIIAANAIKQFLQT